MSSPVVSPVKEGLAPTIEPFLRSAAESLIEEPTAVSAIQQYLLERFRGIEIVPADAAIMESEVYILIRQSLAQEQEWRTRLGLTPREAEVARLLARRRTNKEIARDLNIKQKTARRHTACVLAKLGLDSRLAVERAIAARVIP